MKTQTAARPKTASLLDWRYRYRNIPYYVFLILFSLITILIFLWLVESSFKINREVFGNVWAIPATPLKAALTNYTKAWNLSHMSIYFANSLIVTLFAVLLVVLIAAPAAYALSRVNFPGNAFVTYYFIAGLGLPYQLILVPLFVMLTQLHLANTLQGLILTYVGVSVPFTIMLLTSFFRTLPTELEDAGAIDGCSEFEIFWKVMMPLAGPGIFTAAIFNFVSMWNEFLLAKLIVNNDALKTLPLGVMSIRSSMQYTADWSGLFAAVVIVIIPNFIAYLLFSDRIMAGLTLGSSR